MRDQQTQGQVTQRILTIIWIILGFSMGLLGSIANEKPPRLVEGILSCVLPILVLPRLVEFVFRLNVAVGAFHPPWEAPSSANRMNPLSFVRLGFLLFIAVGVASTISIAWRGLAAAYHVLLSFSGALACHLALHRLLRRFPPPGQSQ